jgi:NAD(P)-dependent dehydrogenase (short-subunit alcohol dehydrogenase family)
MQLHDKIIVVTGGANGIGRALCRRFAAEKPRTVIVADLQATAAEKVASEVSGTPITCNVGHEPDVRRLVERVHAQFGTIDLFCSNAGVGARGGVEAPELEWSRSWEVNVMAHVYAARAVLPAMLERGSGYLLQTVSAAGLLTQLGSAPYAVTKHAALALAEWISITYGDRGIKVSALCPQGVRTDMLRRAEFAGGAFLLDTALEPEQVAEEVVKGLADERFLILPHPEFCRIRRLPNTSVARPMTTNAGSVACASCRPPPPCSTRRPERGVRVPC